MLTSIRGLCAASFVTGLALSAAPALAETPASEIEFNLASVQLPADATIEVVDLERVKPEVEKAEANYIGAESSIELSGNVALVSEYRFRGIDLSGGDIAVQGGFDLAHSSGLYVGTWGSSLDEDTVGFGHTELDVYAGFGGDLTEGVSFDIGGIAYLYPNAGPGDFDYFELYGSVGFTFGPASTTIGVAYAPDQASLGDTDNLYIYNDWSLGIPGTPATVNAHVGYTDGFLTFTDNSKAWDWSFGIEAPVYGPVTVGVAYVGAEDDIPITEYDFADDAIVFTLSASI